MFSSRCFPSCHGSAPTRQPKQRKCRLLKVPLGWGTKKIYSEKGKDTVDSLVHYFVHKRKKMDIMYTLPLVLLRF